MGIGTYYIYPSGIRAEQKSYGIKNSAKLEPSTHNFWNYPMYVYFERLPYKLLIRYLDLSKIELSTKKKRKKDKRKEKGKFKVHLERYLAGLDY